MTLQAETQNVIGKTAVIHTTFGDIHIQLFGEKCPRTVENFSVHSRNGYYDGLIMHRVIKVPSRAWPPWCGLPAGP